LRQNCGTIKDIQGVEMKSKKQSSHHSQSHANKAVPRVTHKKLYVTLLLLVVVIIGGFGLGTWFYSTHAMPNVSVGSRQVGNAQPDTIRQAIVAQAPQLSVTFDDNGKHMTVPAKDLGVVVDIEATVQKAMQARALPWQPVAVPLVLANDPGVLIEYAHQKFPSIFVDAKDPEVVFNTQSNQFEVKPGIDGKGLDIKSFEAALPRLAARPQGFVLKLTSAPVAPILEEAKLAKVRDKANDIIKNKVEFKLKGQAIYTAQPADIAGWLHFVPDTTAGTATLEIDKAKVSQLLADKVGPSVASPPVDQKVIVDGSTGAKTVIQQGRAGSSIQDIDKLSADVVTQLGANKPFSSEVSVATAPFKTVTLTGADKWIEVDLSKQRVTLYMGEAPVGSYLVSTGRANTPTQVGTFAVYSKRPVMTMTGTIAGDYYYIPNIKWVSFFDGGEAFHGTYWHNNFGHPMSHGCINMTEAAAKILYDFSPIGTKVVVHY
jgi:lipoprotein-anchoring transpeptidase ErfK/SrfK